MSFSIDGSPQRMSWVEIGCGLLLMSIPVTISSFLHLHLFQKYLFSVVRMLIQLSSLGYILIPVFAHPHWLVSTAIVSIMCLISAREARCRTPFFYRGQFCDTLVAVASVGAVVMLVALNFVIPVQPWFTPQYIIPLFGMILNNGLSAVSAGSSTFLTEIGTKRHAVENALAFGATSWEAVLPIVQKAMRMGLMPTLNTMLVLGIVSIPGMMTGQIIGGSPPQQAALYQIAIFLLICTACSLQLLLVLSLYWWRLFDEEDRLKTVLKQRDSTGEDIILTFGRWCWAHRPRVGSGSRLHPHPHTRREESDPLVPSNRNPLNP